MARVSLQSWPTFPVRFSRPSLHSSHMFFCGLFVSQSYLLFTFSFTLPAVLVFLRGATSDYPLRWDQPQPGAYSFGDHFSFVGCATRIRALRPPRIRLRVPCPCPL